MAIIVLGGIGALIVGIRDFTHLDRLLLDVRRTFGRPLTLGLEVLVAADIIKTITVDPSPESVAVLGILVAVRIALSISLDNEVNGMVPWRRAQVERERAAPIEQADSMQLNVPKLQGSAPERSLRREAGVPSEHGGWD